MVGRAILASVLTVGLMAALVVAGLDAGPALGTAADAAAAPPRRPPIVPPAVPVGAREDWAVWTYVDKINQAWGRDWPLAIEWFEELDARYPGNSMVLDKLYVAYLEDARVHQLRGDIPAARQRYEQAARFDPDRGVAQERLAELDAQERATRR
jgi:tetratricopeptide (TPR) repeat protein